MPPHVAHVPIAIDAAAPGASRFTHSAVATLRLYSLGAHSGSDPSPAKGALSVVSVSSGIEPS